MFEFPFLKIGFFGADRFLLFTLIWAAWAGICDAASEGKWLRGQWEAVSSLLNQGTIFKPDKWTEQNRQTLWALASAVVYTLLLGFAGSRVILPEGTALHTAAGVVFQYSEVGMICLTVATAGVFLLKSGKGSCLGFLRQVVGVWTLLAVGAAFLSETLCMWEYANWLWCGLLCLEAFLLAGSRPEKEETPGQQADLFGATESYSDLIGARQRQADQLVDWIEENRGKSYSICITGEWGSGKTSFINGVLDKLRADGSKKTPARRDCVICIRALELDSLESLLKYLFGEMRRELKKRGAYVGVSSEYQQFFRAVAESVTNKGTSELFAAKLFRNADDYREKRKELNVIIHKTMGDDLFLVVVDDIERCSPDKILQFVEFIREVGTLSNCVPVFLTDYDMLQKNMGGDFDEKFFDKFFNQRIELTVLTPEQIMAYLESADHKNLYAVKMQDGQESAWCKGFDLPQKIYEQALAGIEGRIKKYGEPPPAYVHENNKIFAEYEKEYKLKQAQARAAEQRLKEDFSNPRAVRQFYTCFGQHWRQCFRACLVEGIPEGVRESNYKALCDIGIGKVLWLVSFAEVWHSLELPQLKKLGIREYFFGSHALVKDEASNNLLKLLHEVLLGAHELGFKTYSNYQLGISLGVLDQILWETTASENSMNWVRTDSQKYACLPIATSYEKRLRVEIENGQCTAIEQPDYQMVLDDVLEHEPTQEKQKKALEKLFLFAAERDNATVPIITERFFPGSFAGKDSWCTVSFSFELFYNTYCRRMTAGCELGEKNRAALDKWERSHVQYFFRRLGWLAMALLRDMQRDALYDLLKQDMAQYASLEEMCEMYLAELTRIVPQIKWGGIAFQSPEQFYQEMLEKIKAELEAEKLLNTAIMQERVDTMENADVRSIVYCGKVMQFFRDQKRPDSFERCLRETKDIEAAAKLMLESGWQKDDIMILADQLRTLTRTSREGGGTLQKETLQALQGKLDGVYATYKNDRLLDDTMYRMQMDLYELGRTAVQSVPEQGK